MVPAYEETADQGSLLPFREVQFATLALSVQPLWPQTHSRRKARRIRFQLGSADVVANLLPNASNLSAVLSELPAHAAQAVEAIAGEPMQGPVLLLAGYLLVVGEHRESHFFRDSGEVRRECGRQYLVPPAIPVRPLFAKAALKTRSPLSHVVKCRGQIQFLPEAFPLFRRKRQPTAQLPRGLDYPENMTEQRLFDATVVRALGQQRHSVKSCIK